MAFSFLDLLFPPVCLGCKKDLQSKINLQYEFLCDPCAQLLLSNRHQALVCGKCKARLPEGKKICHLDWPYVLGTATSYENEIGRSLVHTLKFNYIQDAAVVLGRFLWEYATSVGLDFQETLLIPIPLTAERNRERGFNQAVLIAEVFGKLSGQIVLRGTLQRLSSSKPQSEMENHEERWKNVHGAFGIKSEEIIKGKRIVLIDDVTTSGATLYEASKTLRNAGARSVIALAVLRA
jgi:ComF family protein